MMDETRIDLTSLSDVDDPQVVREALRTFRKRMLARAAWAGAFVLAAAAILGGQVLKTQEDYVSAIARGSIHNGVQGYYEVGDLRVGVLKVTELPGDRWGLQVVAYSKEPLRGGCCALSFGEEGSNNEVLASGWAAGGAHFMEYSVSTPKEAGPSIPVEVIGEDGGSLGHFTIDLHTMEVG